VTTKSTNLRMSAEQAAPDHPDSLLVLNGTAEGPATALSKLARSRAPEVGEAVVSRCDGPLRAALAEAITTRPSSARSRAALAWRAHAAEETREAYHKRFTSQL
jgi:hypothetical protein